MSRIVRGARVATLAAYGAAAGLAVAAVIVVVVDDDRDLALALGWASLVALIGAAATWRIGWAPSRAGAASERTARAPSETPTAIRSRPSYGFKLEASRRRDEQLRRLGHRQRVWRHNDKSKGYAFAAGAGLQVPREIAASVAFADLEWSDLPDRFAVKPHQGANNRGVFLLVRVDDGRFRDLMDGHVKTVDEVTETYGRLAEAGRVSARCAIEELLAPAPELAGQIDIPDDLKVYCFYDRPVLAMQRRMHGTADRSAWTFRFWSRDGVDMGAVKYPDRCDSDLECPRGLNEVFEAAAVMGRELAVPFCRLDFFDPDRGPVFGELSPHPGPPEVWDEPTDELLGAAWEEAEARLLAAGEIVVDARR